MSPKNKPGSGHWYAKPGSTNKVITIFVILCFLGVMPLLVWSTLPEPSPYISVTTSSAMIETAAAATGMETCSKSPVSANIPGLSSAMIYELSSSCHAPDTGESVSVIVLGFSSIEAQNAAIAEAQMTFKNWEVLNTAAFKDGYNLIVVRAAPSSHAVSQISNSLIEQGVIRIL